MNIEDESMSMSASIIVPVYNEDEILRDNTITLLEYLEKKLDDFEIIIVENGSKDRTLQYAKQLVTNYCKVKTISLSEPSLGEALKSGVMYAANDKIVYFPIDLSVNLSFIPESVKLLDNHQIVVGSKKLKDAKDCRSFSRRIASSVYHQAVRILFRTDLSDTTCVKAYRKNIAKELMDMIPSNSSIFETEVLLEAKKAGLSLIQVPVVVNDLRVGRLSLKYKISSKSQDLFSIRIDVISIVSGIFLIITGLLAIVYLSIQKITMGGGGFLNPYGFLISMLLILFGAQGVVYGLFARLFIKLRKEITQQNSRRSCTGNLFKDERI